MSESRAMRYARPLGWAALSAAPILLTALALVSSHPDTPASLITSAAIAAWIAGALALGAALLHARRGPGPARFVAGLAALVVAGSCGLLVHRGMTFQPVALDARERAELVEGGTGDAARLVHPHLDFSLPVLDPELRPSPEIADQTRQLAGERWASAHRVWAWARKDTEVVVDLARAPAADASTLERAARAVEADLRSATGEVNAQQHPNELVATLESGLPGGGRALTRIALFAKDERAYRLTVTVVTREPTRWRSWLERIRTSG